MQDQSAWRQPTALQYLQQITPSSCRFARRATSILFLIDGTTFGIWAGHIPTFKQQFLISDGRLSIALFALVVGSLVSMPVAGHLSARWGSQRVATAGAIGYCLALILLSVAPTFWLFVASALVFGLARGSMVVSINVQAVLVEQGYARPLMSSFQAFWSVGGLCGAGLTSITLKRGFGVSQSMPVEGILLFCVSLFACRYLLQEETTAEESETLVFQLPHGVLLWLGILAFLGLFGEGVMADWSAVYLKSSVGVSVSFAALGYATYSIAMAIGRFSGDWIVQHLGSVATLKGSGFFTAIGLALALGMHAWIPALAGFTIVGFGLSNAMPILFGTAGRTSESAPGAGIASVTTLGYLGFLVGPPVIGWLSELVGLRMALGLVILFGIAIAVLAKRVFQQNGLASSRPVPS